MYICVWIKMVIIKALRQDFNHYKSNAKLVISRFSPIIIMRNKFELADQGQLIQAS